MNHIPPWVFIVGAILLLLFLNYKEGLDAKGWLGGTAPSSDTLGVCQSYWGNNDFVDLDFSLSDVGTGLMTYGTDIGDGNVSRLKYFNDSGIGLVGAWSTFGDEKPSADLCQDFIEILRKVGPTTIGDPALSTEARVNKAINAIVQRACAIVCGGGDETINCNDEVDWDTLTNTDGGVLCTAIKNYLDSNPDINKLSYGQICGGSAAAGYPCESSCEAPDPNAGGNSTGTGTGGNSTGGNSTGGNSTGTGGNSTGTGGNSTGNSTGGDDGQETVPPTCIDQIGVNFQQVKRDSNGYIIGSPAGTALTQPNQGGYYLESYEGQGLGDSRWPRFTDCQSLTRTPIDADNDVEKAAYLSYYSDNYADASFDDPVVSPDNMRYLIWGGDVESSTFATCDTLVNGVSSDDDTPDPGRMVGAETSYSVEDMGGHGAGWPMEMFPDGTKFRDLCPATCGSTNIISVTSDSSGKDFEPVYKDASGWWTSDPDSPQPYQWTSQTCGASAPKLRSAKAVTDTPDVSDIFGSDSYRYILCGPEGVVVTGGRVCDSLDGGPDGDGDLGSNFDNLYDSGFVVPTAETGLHLACSGGDGTCDPCQFDGAPYGEFVYSTNLTTMSADKTSNVTLGIWDITDNSWLFLAYFGKGAWGMTKVLESSRDDPSKNVIDASEGGHIGKLFDGDGDVNKDFADQLNEMFAPDADLTQQPYITYSDHAQSIIDIWHNTDSAGYGYYMINLNWANTLGGGYDTEDLNICVGSPWISNFGYIDKYGVHRMRKFELGGNAGTYSDLFTALKECDSNETCLGVSSDTENEFYTYVPTDPNNVGFVETNDSNSKIWYKQSADLGWKQV